MDVRWNRLDRSDWNTALPGDATAIQHSWRYGAAAAALGRRVARAEIRDGGRPLALAQIVTRRAGPLTLGLMPRGPAWCGDAGPSAATLRALCRLPGGGMRLLLAGGDPGGAALLPLMTPVHVAVLPLSPDHAAMRAAMYGKWRNALAGAERGRIKCAATIPTVDELTGLMARDRAQGRARGYRGLPPAFLAAWAAAKGPPPRLYIAREGGAVIAAMLFLDHPPGVTYHLGWTGPEGRAANAHHRLLWQAMRDFAAQGRRRIDLGPLDTVNAPGLARFKLGAGAVAADLGPAGLILPKPRFSCWRLRPPRRNVPAKANPAD